MNKSRMLTVLLVLCLLTNGFLVWKLWGPHHPIKGHRHEPKHRIVEALNLTSDQLVAYDSLIVGHRQAIVSLENKIVSARGEWYKQIANGGMAQDSVAYEIALFQQQIELVHYRHFVDIRQLCRGDQLNNFDQLSTELPALFQHSPSRKK
jgi:periplasmic protein CpxP/Spy